MHLYFLIRFLFSVDSIIYGLIDYIQVKHKCPMFNIPYVTTHPTFHLPKFFCLAAISGHLCPTGNSGIHKMTYHELIYHLCVFFCMLQHMRTRTDNGHISFQDIDKLRQFINARLTDKLANTCFTRIICCSLKNITLRIHLYRTEFIAPELTSVFAAAFLFKEDGARRAKFDSYPYDYINLRKNSTQKYR